VGVGVGVGDNKLIQSIKSSSSIVSKVNPTLLRAKT
jgi:hypothetical protein